MPGRDDRAFDLEVPSSWDGTTPMPMLIAFHGGAGNRRSAAAVSCPDGEPGEPGCLPEVAKAKGLVVVRPDGVGSRPLRNVRTWNSGGGVGPWQCTSGPACRTGADDIGYVLQLLDEVERTVPIDRARVYATGLSNGGAMSHRVACELPERFAAIVAVGGANQFEAAGGTCKGAVPVLQVHGTDDPCWSYTTSTASCLDEDDLQKVGVAETIEGWRRRNGCAAVTDEQAIEDRARDDGTTSTRFRYQGCEADVELIRVEGGGHTWPGGNQYLGASTIGRVTRDFDSEALIEFLLRHARR